MKNLLFITTFLLFTTILIAQKKVAVFDPVGEVSDNIKIIIREELSNAVVNTLGFTVLERELINKVLAESKFQMTGHVDDGQIGELGRKMGANYVCYASISFVGKNYYISCKMVDVLTAKIERQNTGMTRSGLDDLFDKAQELSANLLSTRLVTKIQPEIKQEIKLKPNAPTFELNYQTYMALPKDISGTKTWVEAKAACSNLKAFDYNDWYLPSKEELTVLYENKDAIGNFTTTEGGCLSCYWSSTEYSTNYAWIQGFVNGNQHYFSLYGRGRVRCIRRN